MACPKLSTQQVRDAGQHYVAAEISRRGGYAEITSGNRKGVDIVANDVDDQRFIGLQVKTKHHQGPRWAASIRDGRPCQQPVDETKFWVLVDISKDPPEYYVIPAWWMENNIYTSYQEFLAKHGGRRPRNPDSLDHSILVQQVEQWKGRWDILEIFRDEQVEDATD